MNSPATLARLLAVIDASKVPGRLEALFPVGVRPRQLSVRTLLAGMLLTLADGRPAHLSRVHGALVGLDDENRRHLGVVCESKHGPHTLTYRQVEYTFSLLKDVLSKDVPDGAPKETLQEVLDALLEASVSEQDTARSSSLAIDWTDIESFSTRRTKKDGTYADKEASWGHRKGGGPGEKDELFFGYYLSLATMVEDDAGAQVPELVRRMALTSPDHDPVPALVDVLGRLVFSGVGIADVVADSGYAYRVPEHFALRMRGSRRRLGHGPAPERPGHPGHPRRSDLFQRRPLLPGHPEGAVSDRTAFASGKRGGDESPRRPLSRASALQARQDERSRRRRISARRLPGGPGQAALPGAGGLPGTFLLPS